MQEGDKKSVDAKPATTQASAGGVSQASKAAATAGKPAASPSGAQKESKEMVLSRLMKLEPKELMKEIINGQVPLNMLNQVANRLPAEMLQEAVDFLSKSESDGAAQKSAASSSTQPCERLSAPLQL